MSVRVSDLQELARDMSVALLAGEKGLSTSVRWYHMVETPEIAEFLAGGEIVFTTGVGAKSEAELLALIKAVIERDASAMVINTGKYVPKIPKNAVDLADENNFPLFECPWEVHMADIMKRLSLRIADEEKTNAEIITAITALLTASEQKSSCAHLLELHGYKRNSFCCCSLTEFTDENGRQSFPVSVDYESLQDIARSVGAQLITTKFFGRLLSVVIADEEETVADTLQALHLFVCESTDLSARSASGAVVDKLDSIDKSYGQAERVISMGDTLMKNGELVQYAHTGVYQLLLAINDSDVLLGYWEATVGRLRRHDSEQRGGLCEAVRAYIACDGSLKAAADELGVHKNTVLNKIKKSEELLGIDLSSAQARCSMLIGFCAEDLLERQN